MHELSIALSILESAAEECRDRGLGRVAAIHLRIGPLAGVLPEALRSAYELAAEDSEFQGSSLCIETAPILLNCPTCGREQPAVSVQEMRCRKCGTYSSQVVGGRELEITGLEVVES